MKKLAIISGGAVAGFLTIVGIHSQNGATVLGSKGSSNVSAAPSSQNSGNSGGNTGGAPSGQSGNSGTPQTGNSGTPSTTTTASSARPTSNGVIKTATGPIEQYGYGELAVKVTVNGNKIANVSIVGLKVAESYSASIANQVGPMLKSQVISAQSAQINGVSGATYTAQAYVTSLQAALTTLQFK